MCGRQRTVRISCACLGRGSRHTGHRSPRGDHTCRGGVGEIGISTLGSIREPQKVGHFRDHKPNICAPNFGRIGNGVPIEYCGQETHFWTPLIKLYAMVQSFFFWSTIFDDFEYFLMILGVFGAIRVESRPTKCLTGDIMRTLGGIRNVVEVVGGWPQL